MASLFRAGTSFSDGDQPVVIGRSEQLRLAGREVRRLSLARGCRADRAEGMPAVARTP